MRRSIALIFSTLCLLGSQNGSSEVVFDFVPFGGFDAGQENFAAAITVDETDVAAGTAAVEDVDLLVTFTVVPTGIDPLDITLTAVDINPAGTNQTLTFSADRQIISAFAQDIPGAPSLGNAWLLTQSFNPPGEPLIDVDHVAILRATEISLESLITQAGGPDLLFVTSVVAGEWRRRFLVVDIDIKPGSDPNSINPRSKGIIPLAILTDGAFDALQVDPTSVQFGPDEASIAHAQGHAEDVDDDGDADLVLHFRTRETGIACGDTDVTLTGETYEGQPITGTDVIKTVGCKKK